MHDGTPHDFYPGIKQKTHDPETGEKYDLSRHQPQYKFDPKNEISHKDYFWEFDELRDDDPIFRLPKGEQMGMLLERNKHRQSQDNYHHDDHDTHVDKTVGSCSASELRTSNKRDDFHPIDHQSRIRFALSVDKFVVEIDQNSDDNWQSCVTIKNLAQKLPAGWIKKARFAILAKTGDLADNHDVVSLLVHDSHKEGVLSARAQIDDLAKIDDMTKYIHQLEHKLDLIFEHIDHAMKTMRSQEEALTLKVMALESNADSISKKNAMQKIEENNKKLANEYKHHVIKDFRKKEILGTFSKWKMPFYLLSFIVLAGFGCIYKKYRQLVKSHIL